MPSVFLSFIPPDREGFVKLHIYEASSADVNVAAQEIEVVTPVGTWPDYITEYSTSNALSPSHWFSIQWEDDKGVLSDMSDRLQGNSETLVGIITDRVMLRDPAFNRTVVAQEAEAAICTYFNVTDPFSIDPSIVSPKVISGLTYLTMARSYIARIFSTSTAASWTAGLVSMKSQSGSAITLDSVQDLLKFANADLGRSFSYVLLMKEIEVGGGFKRVAGIDLTRTLVEIT